MGCEDDKTYCCACKKILVDSSDPEEVDYKSCEDCAGVLCKACAVPAPESIEAALCPECSSNRVVAGNSNDDETGEEDGVA